MSRFYFEYDTQKERNRVISTTYITYASIAVCCAPILLATTNFFADIILDSAEKYADYFTISFISLLIGVSIDIGLMYLRIIKKPFIFITITISRLIMLISLNIFFLVYLKLGVLGILYSTLISRILYAVVVTVPILWKTKLSFSPNVSIDIIKFGLPLVPATLASKCIKQSDKYFIRYFASIADTGIYSLALKLGNTIHILITLPFATAYIPRRFEIMKKNKAKEVYSKVFSYYTFLIVFVGLAISVLVPEILQIMVTPEFFRAGTFVPLIVLSMIIYGFQFHFDFGILWSKKTKYSAYINFYIAILNLGLNFLLIPKFGIWGAIMASVLVLAAQTISTYLISNKLFPIHYEFLRLSKFFLVACSFYLFSLIISTSSLILNIFLKSILLSVFLYITFIFKIFTQQEVQKLQAILSSLAEKYLLLKKPLNIVSSLIKY